MRSIGAWQTGMICGIEALIIAVLAVVVMLVGLSRFTSAAGMGAMAAAGSVVVVVVMLIAYPVVGFIGGALLALAYNLAGLIGGGVEVETVG
ncbi:MAG: hypothetical protein FJX75_21515 [Armatimonadetes bacterium]|nr:hypothetical protein [Armatimonadota bacterium]